MKIFLLFLLFSFRVFAGVPLSSGTCQNAMRIPDKVLSKIEEECSRYRSDRAFETCESTRFLMYGLVVESVLYVNPMKELFQVNMVLSGEMTFQSEMEATQIEGDGSDLALTFLSADGKNISIQTRLYTPRERSKKLGASVLVPNGEKMDFYFFKDCHLNWL